MQTERFTTLRRRDVPPLMLSLIRYVPYEVAASAAACAFAITRELAAPRGTLLWLHNGGVSLSLLALLSALCALSGALFWRRARKSALWSVVLCAVLMLPFIGICCAGGVYLTTIANVSSVVLVAYVFGCAFGVTLLAVILTLAAWLEVSALERRFTHDA